MSTQKDMLDKNKPIPEKGQTIKYLGNTFTVTRVVPTSKLDGNKEPVYTIFLSDTSNILSNNYIDSQRDTYEIVASSVTGGSSSSTSEQHSIGDFQSFNILKYFQGHGWYKGRVASATRNDDGIVSYHVMYDEDDDKEDLDETEVEKWRNYEQMNPQPTGPLIEGDNFAHQVDEGDNSDLKDARKGSCDFNESLRNKNEDEAFSDVSSDSADSEFSHQEESEIQTTQHLNDSEKSIDEKTGTGSVDGETSDPRVGDSDGAKTVSLEGVGDGGSKDESVALVVRSLRRLTLGETVTSSFNSSLNFTNNYHGLSSIPHINTEHGLQNDNRLIAVTNNGSTISVHAQHTMRQEPLNASYNFVCEHKGSIHLYLAELPKSKSKGISSESALSRGLFYSTSHQHPIPLFNEDLPSEESRLKIVFLLHAVLKEQTHGKAFFFGSSLFLVGTMFDFTRPSFSGRNMSEVMIMNSRAITRNAMTDIEVMAATRKNEEELRELAIAAEKNFSTWFNNGHPTITSEQCRHYRRTSKDATGDPLIIELPDTTDLEKKALQSMFQDNDSNEEEDDDDEKQRATKKIKEGPKSRKRSSGGGRLREQLTNLVQEVPSDNEGSASDRKQTRKKSMNYDVDSRVGKKSPDLSNHDDRVPYVEGQRLQTFIPGLSPMSVRVREDLAKYKAESEAKSEMLQMTKAFQEAICASSKTTLEVSEKANMQVRSMWDVTESRNARSELMRVQAQAYSQPNPTSIHRDMFFGLGQVTAPSSFETMPPWMPPVAATPRRQGFLHEPFQRQPWYPGDIQSMRSGIEQQQAHLALEQQASQSANNEETFQVAVKEAIQSPMTFGIHPDLNIEITSYHFTNPKK